MATRHLATRWWVWLGLLWGGLTGAWLAAQTPEDIDEFMAAGKRAYEARRFREAATEFENVIMLDGRNVKAKIMLAKCCVELKLVGRARELLMRARLQAPDDDEVKLLTEMLKQPVAQDHPRKEGDLALHEQLAMLASSTARPFGLVIPPSKVTRPATLPSGNFDQDAPLAATDPIAFPDDTVTRSVAQFTAGADKGPLASVFNTRVEKGLMPALDRYFELVEGNQDLLSEDDHGLLGEGLAHFKPRVENNPDDRDSRVYYAMILWLNGSKQQAFDVANPLHNIEDMLLPQHKKLLATVDKWRRDEDTRMAEIKRLADENAAAAAAASAAAAAASANASAAVAAAMSGSGSAAGIASASSPDQRLDQQGYEAYKKGKLEEAIACYQQGIKINAKSGSLYYHLGLAYTDKGLGGDMASFDRAIEAFNQVMRIEPGSRQAKDAETMIKDINAAKTSLKP